MLCRLGEFNMWVKRADYMTKCYFYQWFDHRSQFICIFIHLYLSSHTEAAKPLLTPF